jgi:hypothetical protein
MSDRRKQRPGFYGRIYGDMGTHPKWVGGYHKGRECKPLSWAARGLWTALVSLSVRNKSDGAFVSADIQALGADQTMLDELVGNRLVDSVDGKYCLHDYGHHAMTSKEWKKKLTGTAVRRDRMEQKNAGGTSEEREGNAEGTRSDTRSALTLSLRSDQEISEPPTVPAAGPPPRPGTARRWGLLASRARLAVEAACRDRRCGLPAQCSEPDHNDWCKLARWAEGVEGVRASDDALTAEAALDFAVAEWLASDAPSIGFSPHWFADNPNKYFLAEAIEARSKRREVAA